LSSSAEAMLRNQSKQRFPLFFCLGFFRFLGRHPLTALGSVGAMQHRKNSFAVLLVSEYSGLAVPLACSRPAVALAWSIPPKEKTVEARLAPEDRAAAAALDARHERDELHLGRLRLNVAAQVEIESKV
jgi:hypothetical protein